MIRVDQIAERRGIGWIARIEQSARELVIHTHE